MGTEMVYLPMYIVFTLFPASLKKDPNRSKLRQAGLVEGNRSRLQSAMVRGRGSRSMRWLVTSTVRKQRDVQLAFSFELSLGNGPAHSGRVFSPQ